ncbi:hypothetical protein BASA81_009056 [Batrachochytrium salamandrivorans]|nr:hypothetical protein BASA81_009056 [Batrachochytrium salamandrivorans]
MGLVAKPSKRELSLVSRRRFSTAPAPKPEEEATTSALTTITFKEGAKAGANFLLLGGIAAGCLGCGFLIFQMLSPSKLGPNNVFNSAFEKIRNHSEVVARLGSPVKGYGREFSSGREGRRNFVDFDEYQNDDGVWCTRVKFNLEGPNGKAVCYAEKKATDEGPEDFEYIIMEHVMRGRKDAIALIDNRRVLSRAEIQDKVTKKFANADMQLFGHSNCQWTKKQLEELGEFSERIKVLYCDKAENLEECTKAQLKGYPTWRYKEQNIPGGFQTLEQLQYLAKMV